MKQFTGPDRSVNVPSVPVTIHHIASVGEWDSLRPVWDSLLAVSEVNNIFLTHSWLRCWWDAFGREKQLFILTAETEGHPACIAPFMIDSPNRTLSFIGSPEADYAGFIGTVAPHIVESVMSFLITRRDLWDTIDLSQIPEGTQLHKCLAASLVVHRLPFRSRHADQCLGYRYDGDPAKRNDFTIRRGHEVKRLLNFFKGEGGITIERLESLDAIVGKLDELMHMHIVRWRGTPTPSQFVDERYQHFFRSLAMTMFQEGRVCFVVSRKGDTPVGMSFNYDYQGVIYHYTLAYNLFYNKKSPGTIHVILQSELLVRTGFDLDLARGAGPYKKTLSNWQRPNMQILVYPSSFSRKVATLWESAKATWIGRKLTDNRHVMDIKMRLQGMLSDKGIILLPLFLCRSLFRRLFRTSTVVSYRCSLSSAADKCQMVRSAVLSDVERIAAFLGIQRGTSEHDDLLAQLATPNRFWIVGDKSISGIARREQGETADTGMLSDVVVSQVGDAIAIVQGIIKAECDHRKSTECIVTAPSRSQIANILESINGVAQSKRRSFFVLGKRIAP